MDRQPEMTGMERLAFEALKLLINKMSLPPEAVNRLQEMARDGTFERFTKVPADLAEIKTRIARIERYISGLSGAAGTSAVVNEGNTERPSTTDAASRFLGNGVHAIRSSEPLPDNNGPDI